MSFIGLLIVCLVAVVAPLITSAIPRVRVPAIVLEILGGILIGPAGLGWVRPDDDAVRVLSIVGLGFLLFLAGLELDVKLLRGARLRTTSVAFLLSAAMAYAIAFALHVAGIVESTLLVAICLSATALGVVAPVLKDAGELTTDFGQTVIAAASIADFSTVLLLSIVFSRESGSTVDKLVLLGGFGVLTAVVVAAMMAAEHWTGLSLMLEKLQDSTAQIRVRGAFLLLIGFAALATRQGLEVILGAFVAGALLSVLDHDYARTHPRFHDKLEAIGFGVFIPVFFVASGVQFDAGALFSGAGTLLRVPLFLAALLLVRGVPALLYRPLVGLRRSIVAGLMQATSLPFIVAATTIGIEMHALARPNASALVAAGLLSVVIFPVTATILLRDA
ncbi:MAG TPA: cation:proton antiporter [Vicinamibacterales bacterium]|jgi:Kef-type K+ transport system membrane component KefB|nr:cation:proton antiporter [Vicinamibacterales bacterium]